MTALTQNEWNTRFAQHDEAWAREQILSSDNAEMLEHYIAYQHHAHQHQLTKYPTVVQSFFDCWWTLVCTPSTPQCARALHEFFLTPNSAMASPARIADRLLDMCNAPLWEAALEHFDPVANGIASWLLLQNIFHGDNGMTNEQQVWERFDVFLGKGGMWEDQSLPSAARHVLLTPLPMSWAEDGEADKIKTLYKKGVSPTGLTAVHFKYHDAPFFIQQRCFTWWDEHVEEMLNLTVSGELTQKHTRGQRKI